MLTAESPYFLWERNASDAVSVHVHVRMCTEDTVERCGRTVTGQTDVCRTNIATTGQAGMLPGGCSAGPWVGQRNALIPCRRSSSRRYTQRHLSFNTATERWLCSPSSAPRLAILLGRAFTRNRRQRPHQFSWIPQSPWLARAAQNSRCQNSCRCSKYGMHV